MVPNNIPGREAARLNKKKDTVNHGVSLWISVGLRARRNNVYEKKNLYIIYR